MRRLPALLRRHPHLFALPLAIAALGLGLFVYNRATGTPSVEVVHAAVCPQGRAPTGPISVTSGQSFTVMLAANHNTIAHWALSAPPAAPVLQLIGSTYYSDHVSGPRGFVGFGGVECWTFRALAPGNTTLGFSTVVAEATPTAEQIAAPEVTVPVTVTAR